MEDDMSPPNKRRKLSPSRSELSIVEPTPTTAHSIQPPELQLASAGVRTAPQHIQEIHLQIQERSPQQEQEDYNRIHRRQGAAASVTTETTVINGSTVVSTITIGATTPSSTSSSSTTSTGTGGFIGKGASPQGSSNSTSGQSSSGSSGTGHSHITKSHNGTATHNSPKQSKGHKGHHTSLGKNLYLTTLHNGNVKTLTRSDKPYLTTFGNGQVATVCDRHHDCKFTTHKTKKTSKTTPSSTPSSSSLPAVTSTKYVGGAHAGHESPTAAAGGTTNLAQHNSSNHNSTPPPGTIAGGVVGGAAGLAVILLIAMVFLRWYKRRSQQGHHALPPSSVMSPEVDYASSSRGPGMAERAGLMPFVGGSIPSFFRHTNRSQEEPAPSERGFTRVSGRKLPSAFSEGMSSGGISSPAPDIPQKHPERNLSTTSWYRDSAGFYGGEGVSPERAESPPEESPSRSDDAEVVLSPGPRRTPTLHTGGPYFMSPTSSAPNTPRLPTVPGSPTVETPLNVARSETPSTLPDNRSSKFTEEV